MQTTTRSASAPLPPAPDPAPRQEGELLNRERLTWLLDILVSRGLIHEGQKKDVLNRGEDQARHLMLDRRAELRRLLGKRRVSYTVAEIEVVASFRFRTASTDGEDPAGRDHADGARRRAHRT